MRRKLWSALGFATAGLMSTLAGCDEPDDPGVPEPDYGVPVQDGDGDGWLDGEDCDDGDADVHPEADEDCDDGVDNDCDGATDAEDVDCEQTDRSLWQYVDRGVFNVFRIFAGEPSDDTGGPVPDYCGWAPDYDDDGWYEDEDPDDHDPTVTGASQP